MSALVEDQLVADVAQDQVEQIAPREMPLFPLLSETYFQDPEKTLKGQAGKDEPLGFGIGEVAVFLTPAVLEITNLVVGYLATEVLSSVKSENPGFINDLVKRMFKKFRKEGGTEGKELPPPLSREQIVRVREIALDKGRQLQLSSDQAELLADSLVGSLATAV